METTYEMDVFSGNPPDPSGGADPFSALTPADIHYFSNATKILHIWSLDNALLIRFSFTREPLDWMGGIRIPDAQQSQDFYHSALAFQVVNLTIGATAWFQVVGMW